jgi:hypothetical protein
MKKSEKSTVTVALGQMIGRLRSEEAWIGSHPRQNVSKRFLRAQVIPTAGSAMQGEPRRGRRPKWPKKMS